MSVYLNRLTVGWPDHIRAPDDWEGCWKIYTICRTAQKGSCTTRADVSALTASDKKDARSTYVNFTNRANTGEPLTTLYDEKQCHEAHSFDMNGTEVKIFRIWGSGKIRVYFCYLPGKKIAVLKTAPKRKDNLSDGEKLELENIARELLECLSTNTFDSRII